MVNLDPAAGPSRALPEAPAAAERLAVPGALVPAANAAPAALPERPPRRARPPGERRPASGRRFAPALAAGSGGLSAGRAKEGSLAARPPPAPAAGRAEPTAPRVEGNAAPALRPDEESRPQRAPARRPEQKRRPALAVVGSAGGEPPATESGRAPASDLGVELRVLWGTTLLDASTFVAPAAPVHGR